MLRNGGPISLNLVKFLIYISLHIAKITYILCYLEASTSTTYIDDVCFAYGITLLQYSMSGNVELRL
jgi:hypothetical protein